MKPAPFNYYAPTSIDEAVALLAELGPQEGRILAGGQSLVPTMAFRAALPAHLIDINGIADLAKVVANGEFITIGACVRHAAFENEAATGPTGALLRKVVQNIAHYPIRTRGTFCGSVANADPASEWCCVMTALGGVVVLRSRRGTRRVAAAEFFQGVMATALEEDELVIAAELPILPMGTCTGFLEFSRRKGDFAIAMALVAYDSRVASLLSHAWRSVASKRTRAACLRPRKCFEGEYPRPACLRKWQRSLPRRSIRWRTSITTRRIAAAWSAH
jgi:carbon-monoxide dehydrogenase medium subunit